MAGGGTDTLIGAHGNDTLTGGAGADQFIIHQEAGATDWITDFAAASLTEGLTFVGFAGLTEFDDLTLTQVGADLHVALVAGQTVILQDTVRAALSSAHVRFVKTYDLYESTTVPLAPWAGTAEDDYYVWYRTDDQIFYAGAGDDLVFGHNGNDEIHGGQGDDRLGGEQDSDVPVGGNDRLYGEEGDDQLYGGGGDDILFGGSGHDTLQGKAGDDELYGGTGRDILYGQDGNDILHIEGGGRDYYLGGAGQDRFVIHASQAHEWYTDTAFDNSRGLGFLTSAVYDLELGQDTLDFRPITTVRGWEDIEIHVSNWTVFGEAYTGVYFENQHNVRQWLMLRNVTQSEVTAIEALFYENQGPQAEGDDFITQEDRPLQIAITDLLENDTDHEDGIPMFDSILEGPVHGTVEETGTGTLIYVPAANFHGHPRCLYVSST